MNTITTSAPPVPNTSTSLTWEGYARADKILPGDDVYPGGEAIRVDVFGASVWIVTEGDKWCAYAADEMLYIKRTVTVIFSQD